jgi:hypothetical protein
VHHDHTDRALMRGRADSTLGAVYGYGDKALQAIDALASKLLRRPIRCARRFASTRWVECSGNVADVWAAAGLGFDVETGTASPDDIADFVVNRPDRYEFVRSLVPSARRRLPWIRSTWRHHERTDQR